MSFSKEVNAEETSSKNESDLFMDVPVTGEEQEENNQEGNIEQEEILVDEQASIRQEEDNKDNQLQVSEQKNQIEPLYESIQEKQIVETEKEVKRTHSFSENTTYFSVQDTQIPVYNNGSQRENTLVGYLLPGKEYKIQRFSDGHNWIVVSFGNKNAYVRSSQVIPSSGKNYTNAVNTDRYTGGFLTNSKVAVYEQASNRSSIYAYLEKNVKYSVIGKYYNFRKNNVGGRIDYIHQDNMKKTFTTKTKFFKTKQSIPIYYQTPSGDKRVGTLLPNKEYGIQRFSEGVKWIVISFGHQNAYIRAKDVIPINGDDFKKPVKSNRSSGKATIHSQAAAYIIPDNQPANLYAYLETGVTYEVLGSYYNYYFVNIAGHYGYVHKDNTKQVTTYNVADHLQTIGKNQQLILVTSNGYGTNKARIRTFEKKEQNGMLYMIIKVF